jgi:hypothetical protein
VFLVLAALAIRNDKNPAGLDAIVAAVVCAAAALILGELEEKL